MNTRSKMIKAALKQLNALQSIPEINVIAIEQLKASLLECKHLLTELIVNEKEVEKQIELLRNELRKIRAHDKAKQEEDAFYKLIFDIQISFAKQFPVNKKEDGYYIDPISLGQIEDVNKENIIATSNGHLINKSLLNQYFSGNNAFRQVTDHDDNISIDILHPVSRDALSAREVAYLRKKGVTIPEPNRTVVALNRSILMGNTQLDLLGYRPTAVAGHRGRRLGNLIGLFVGFLAAMTLGFLWPATPISMAIIFGISLVGGIIENKRNGGRFGSSAVSIFCGSIIAATTLTLFAAPIIGLLASQSVIGSATAGASFWTTYILPYIPVLIGVIGSIAEYFKPKALVSLFKSITSYPILAGMFIFGSIGAFLGEIGHRITHAFNRTTPQPAPLLNQSSNAAALSQSHTQIQTGFRMNPPSSGTRSSLSSPVLPNQSEEEKHSFSPSIPNQSSETERLLSSSQDSAEENLSNVRRAAPT